MPLQRFRPGDFRRFDGGHEWFHALFGIALLVVVILLAVWLVYSIRRTATPQSHAAAFPGARPDAALEEARVRYARGEITREQYIEIASDLGGPVPPTEPPAKPSRRKESS